MAGKRGVRRSNFNNTELNGTMKIEGRIFRFKGWYFTKKEAQTKADKFRKRGNFARVICMPNSSTKIKKFQNQSRKTYWVWVAPKRGKK